MRFPILAPLVFIASLALPAAAHEFWIDPVDTQVAAGAPVQAHLRVGEKLKGSSFPFLPRDFRLFVLNQNSKLREVKGRLGDRPALNMTVGDEGLVTVVHVTRHQRLTYNEWDKFLNFTSHKNFPGIVDVHIARGLPETGFVELYSRHAKSLIGVGHGRGKDKKVGLDVEIVAEANPYTDDMSRGMPVRVYYKGRPVAGGQVELFERASSGAVKVKMITTDRNGRAMLPVRKGRFYLADHVVMRELNPRKDGDPVWESLWASLTFGVPR